MAKKATKPETKPETPEVICSPLVDGKITATASIVFGHPYEPNTAFHPSVTIECEVGPDRPLTDALMDDLIGQASAALDRSKRKVTRRLVIENQLSETRARMAVLEGQEDRPLSDDTKAAYTTELQELVELETSLIQELETLKAE